MIVPKAYKLGQTRFQLVNCLKQTRHTRQLIIFAGIENARKVWGFVVFSLLILFNEKPIECLSGIQGEFSRRRIFEMDSLHSSI